MGILPIAEADVQGYEYTSWNGLFVPKGTPRAIVLRLHSVTQKVLVDAEVKQLYANQVLPGRLRPHGEAGEGRWT